MNSRIKMQMQYTLEVLTNAMNESNATDGTNYENPLQFCKDCFLHYDNENERKRFPNTQQRIANWLNGGVFTFPCYNKEMLELRDKWGYSTKDNKWTENFFVCLSNNILKLAKKYKVVF